MASVPGLVSCVSIPGERRERYSGPRLGATKKRKVCESMKATVDYHEFMTVIAALDRAATHDEARSVFDLVRFTVEGAKLKIDAYDGNDGVHVTLEADDVYALEDGSAVVRLNELAPILRQIKAGFILRIEAAGGEVWLHFGEVGHAKLSYKFLEPEERLYQFVGKIEKVFKRRERTVGFVADAISLSHDISCVKSAMADYERRSIAGVHCEMEGDSVRFVATNGRVIVEHSHVADNPEKKPDGVGFIPRQFVRMLETLLQAFPGAVQVGFDKDGGGINIGGVVSLVWEFESAFPDWRGVIPTEKPVNFIEIKNVRSVGRALGMVNRKWDRVEDEDGAMDTGCGDECVFATDDKGGMVITGDVVVGHYCNGAVKSCWSIPVECCGVGKEPIVIKLNPNYLRACFENCADLGSVVMEYRGENQPVKFCGTCATAVVMPYRD